MMGTIRTFVAMPDWQQLEILRQAMPVFGPQFEQVGASVDGAALLRCLSEHPDRVDLVLTDLFLRDMDAVELLEHINRLQLAHPPRVLITAGTGNEPLRSKLFSLGADYCLAKPYTLQKLFERAQLICGKEPQAPLPRVRRLLDRLALVPNDCGYLYLEDAVQAMVRTKAPHALVKEVYREVAAARGVSPRGVESGIRREIQRMQEKNTPLFQALRQQCGGDVSNGRALRFLAECLHREKTQAGQEAKEQ